MTLSGISLGGESKGASVGITFTPELEPYFSRGYSGRVAILMICRDSQGLIFFFDFQL